MTETADNENLAVSDERGALRIICGEPNFFASLQGEMGGQVCALVGPIGEHTSHPELQDALTLVAMAFNRRHGRLSEQKHKELLREDYAAGAELLRDALAEFDAQEPGMAGNTKGRE